MPHDFYHRLSGRDRRTYDRSDAVTEIRLPEPARARAELAGLEAAHAGADRKAMRRTAQALVDAVTAQLALPKVAVRILDVRPSGEHEELHGYYEQDDDGRAIIRVWTRTSARKAMVGFRTFLRTLLHEVVHHVDFEQLGLETSFHTAGFFRRESSLMRQIAGAAPARLPRSKPRPQPTPPAPARQLDLF